MLVISQIEARGVPEEHWFRTRADFHFVHFCCDVHLATFHRLPRLTTAASTMASTTYEELNDAYARSNSPQIGTWHWSHLMVVQGSSWPRRHRAPRVRHFNIVLRPFSPVSQSIPPPLHARTHTHSLALSRRVTWSTCVSARACRMSIGACNPMMVCLICVFRRRQSSPSRTATSPSRTVPTCSAI